MVKKDIHRDKPNIVSVESEDYIQSMKLTKERTRLTKERNRPTKECTRLTKKPQKSKRSKIITKVPQLTEESMIGETNDLRPINFLLIGAKIQEAVSRVEVKAITSSRNQLTWYGTGFMISDDLLMTNYHVIPDPNTHPKIPNRVGETVESILECDIQFNYQVDWNNMVQNPWPTRFDLDPNYYVGDEKLDYAIVRLANNPGKKFGKVLLDYTTRVFEQTPVIIIQHPNGQAKQIALEHNIVTRIRRDEKDDFPPYLIRYTTDTEEGSSGSPIFTPAWDFVGLHHGNMDSMNEGTLSKTIIDDIVEKLSGLSNEMQKYLKAALIESNLPSEIMNKLQLGDAVVKRFFGFLGLATKEEVSGYKKILSNSTANSAFFDFGYWNIDRILKGGMTTERIVDESNYVHDMGIDLWVVDRISQPVLESIRMVLKNNYNQNFSYFLPGQQALAYDASKITCEIEEYTVDSPEERTTILDEKPMFVNIKNAGINRDNSNVNLILLDLNTDSSNRVDKMKTLLSWISESIRKDPDNKYIIFGDWESKMNLQSLDGGSKYNKLIITVVDVERDKKFAMMYVQGSQSKTLFKQVVISKDSRCEYNDTPIKIIKSPQVIPPYHFASVEGSSSITPLVTRFTY